MEQENVKLASVDALSRAVLGCVRTAHVMTLPEIVQKLPERFADRRTGEVYAKVALLVAGGYLDADAGGREVVYTVACIGTNGRYIKTIDQPPRVVSKATKEDVEYMGLLIQSARLFHHDERAAA